MKHHSNMYFVLAVSYYNFNLVMTVPYQLWDPTNINMLVGSIVFLIILLDDDNDGSLASMWIFWLLDLQMMKLNAKFI